MQKLWEYLFNEDTGHGVALTTLFYNAPYKKTYDFVKHSEWWTAEQTQSYQWQQLTHLLQHAYEHVPYYKKLFKTKGITPNDIRSLQDFQQLPVLTKEAVQEHANELKATNYPAHSFQETNTGGSTGFSLRFPVEKGVWYAKHLAYITILLERGGCHAMDKSVQIIGREKPWENRLLPRTLVLSSYSMTDQNLPIYLQKIKRLQPHYFIGYPSAITLLATYMKHHSIELKGLKSIFCYGETLYEWQREFLEAFLHCRVHGQYGHREQCVLAGTCEKSNFYHIFPDYGFVELIDREGQPVTKDGESGEIVATGFHTGIFPFIRYKTGDIATYSTHQCACGRHYPLFRSVEGRVQDFMISKTSRPVPLMGVLQLISKSSPNMKEYQLYQDREGEIILHIVKKEGFSDDDVFRIRENIKKRLGDEFSLSLQYMDSIPRTGRGKYQFLVQKLPIKNLL
ncbi:MAG TPA: phenylacetate--CoA ligase family protein [Thermoplasmata archaeon]|jgi:phenylacetate-CoA ligase|nr:MAG TPA: phenylacetate--CoA ligase family protein [Thermoplasmata archaeon]